jgi:hypothetical protein
MIYNAQLNEQQTRIQSPPRRAILLCPAYSLTLHNNYKLQQMYTLVVVIQYSETKT